MTEDDIHKSPLLKALRTVLSHIPHRHDCALVSFKFSLNHKKKTCDCDVGDRVAIAYGVVANLLLDLRKGTR